MKTSDFDYDLPPELIAQSPMEPRDHSRLMVVSRTDGSIEHRRFYDLPRLLQKGDVLVFNDSRVFPARLRGRRVGSGGRVEVLLLSRLAPDTWRALVRPGRRMGRGASFESDDAGDAGEAGGVRGEVVSVEADGSRVVRLTGEENLHRAGEVPLPPYIHEALEDPERYQTVYSRVEGSVAAPTAGLHFTPELLEQVRARGVETVFVTLHVGWDSFRPVKTEQPSEHAMHSEYWELGRAAATAVNRAKAEGRRVVSIGTTATRLLEHSFQVLADHPGHTDRSQMAAGHFDNCRVPATAKEGRDQRETVAAGSEGQKLKETVAAGSGWADLFILPGHRFGVVDALVTNFHLPRSTLLMLTSAFAGRDLLMRAYAEAIAHRYRFYSFGDAMVIV